jgi:hypothetical protein
MTHRFRILIITGLIICTQQILQAQVNQNKKFLQKVGVLDSLYSEVLKESREIYVQLPASYNAENNEKYPIVYILDGEVFLPTAKNVLDFYSGGFMPEMVLIGISNSSNRMRDLTTSTVKTMYGMPFDQENGKAANFIQFMENELIPFVEKKYPVTNYRTLIGHSYGGLFTAYTLINHPNLFANYIAIDPSLDWDNQSITEQAKTIFANQNFEGKSLFMSLGGQLHMQNPEVTLDNVMQDDSDFTVFARSNINFSNLIKQNPDNGLSFDWKFYPKDLHGTISYPSIMDGLISVFEWYQMENTAKFNSLETSKEELSTIINYRANKLQSHFGYAVPPYPEDLLNILGDMSIDMGQLEKSKMFFDFAIAFYPNSSIGYSSMANYYSAQENNSKALHFATKAYELSGSEQDKKRMEELK